MSKKDFFLLPLSLFFCAVLALVFFGSTKSRIFAQVLPVNDAPKVSASPNSEPARPRIFIEPTASSAPTISTGAISENVRYKETLEWIFGAKTQRGWYLYAPLIQQTINTNAAADTAEFARAVAVWQKNANFTPTGIVNQETLFQFIKSWQAQRLNSSEYATDAQLLNAPITDFYDPTRGLDLLKVDRETYAAYKRMTAAAAKDLHLRTNADGELAPDENFLKIVSAFRSREHQEKLRAASPASGSAGLAVNSPHFTGHALDLYVGGEPVTTKDYNRALQIQTPAYQWLVVNAAKFGFYPYYYEPWHWEYVPQNAKNSEIKATSLYFKLW